MDRTKEINLPDIIGKGYKSFWTTKKRYRVCKGGKGSKKSRTTGLWYIYNMMKYPQANTVVVRNVFNTHKDSTFAVLKWAAHRLNVSHLWQFKESPLECIYKPTQQRILFRGFDDIDKLMSITVPFGVLCWAWLEEAFEIDSEEDFTKFDTSIRGELPDGLWKQLTLTFNPWINSHWTKTRFFDAVDLDAFTLTTTYKCNEWLDDADRSIIEKLEVTNPSLFKVVGLGEYGMPGGTFFEEFSESVHVIKPDTVPNITSNDWRRYRVLDYGLDMLACYWIAIDYQGKAYVYKELHESNHIVSQAAKRILDMTLPDEVIYQNIAPPDLWNRNRDTGNSTAKIFQDHGIYLMQASNEFEQGCLDMKEWIYPYDTQDEQTGDIIKTANLKIFNNCINLINSLSSIQKDEKNPNVYAKQPHNLTHSVDSLRYFVAGRPYAPRMETKKKQTNWMFESKQERNDLDIW
jgi:phage terminase large subunit